MIELTFIYSLISRALLLCSIVAGNGGVFFEQSSGKPSDSVSPEPAHPAIENGAMVNCEFQLLTQRLALTVAQQARVKSLLAERHQQVEELRQTMENDPNAVGLAYEKLRTIRRTTDARIAALLTDDQKIAFAEWRQQSNRQMRRRLYTRRNEAHRPYFDPIGRSTSGI